MKSQSETQVRLHSEPLAIFNGFAKQISNISSLSSKIQITKFCRWKIQIHDRAGEMDGCAQEGFYKARERQIGHHTAISI